MKIRKIACLVTVLIMLGACDIVTVMPSGSQNKSKDTPISSDKANKDEISYSIMDETYFLEINGYVYCSLEDQLMRYSSDLKKKEIMTKDFEAYSAMYQLEDEIYYELYGEVHRINLKNGKEEKVYTAKNGEYIFGFFIKNNILYADSDRGIAYRELNSNNDELKLLVGLFRREDYDEPWLIYGNDLFYIDGNNQFKLCRMNLETKKSEIFLDRSFQYAIIDRKFDIYNDELYYIMPNKVPNINLPETETNNTEQKGVKYTLYKMPLTGGESKQIAADITNISIYNGEIFCTLHKKKGIYKMKLDGSGLTRIFDGNILGYNIINNHVYAYNSDKIYKMDINDPKKVLSSSIK